MTRILQFARGAAAWLRRPAHLTSLLLAGMVAASLALAFAGEARAPELAKDYGMGAVAGVAILCSIACSRMLGRPALLALHLGFALVLGGWVVNQIAGKEGRLVLAESELLRQVGPRLAQHHGWTNVGSVDEEFNYALDKFEITYSPDGKVEQFTSRGRIPDVREGADDGRADLHDEKVDISVNHPLVRKGWWVYQVDYYPHIGEPPLMSPYTGALENPQTGEPYRFTILQCVKDAGLPFVAAGGVLLLLGALGLIMLKGRASGGGCPKDGALAWVMRPLYWLVFLWAIAKIVYRVGTRHFHAGESSLEGALDCVSDVGLPLVAFGGVLLLLGAVWFMRRKWCVAPCGSRAQSGNELVDWLAGVRDRGEPSAWLVFAGRALYALAFLFVAVALVRHGFSKVHTPAQNAFEYLMCAAALIPVLMFVCAKPGRRGPLPLDPALLAFAFLPVVLFMNGGMNSLKLALWDSFSLSCPCVYAFCYVILFTWARRDEEQERRGLAPFLLALGLLLFLLHAGLPSKFQREQCLYDLLLCFTAFALYFPSWWNKMLHALYALVSLGLVAMLVRHGCSTGNFPLQNMRECLMCMTALTPFITFAGAKVNGRDSLLAGAVLVALMAPVMLYLDGGAAHVAPTERLYYVPHACAGVLGYVLAVRTAMASGRRPLGIAFTLVTLALLLGLVHWGFAQESGLPPLNYHLSYQHMLCLYDALVCLAVLMVYFPSVRKAAVRGLYALVFLCVVAMLAYRGYKVGHPPMQNMYEFLICTAALLPALTLDSALWDRQNTMLVDAALLAVVLVPVAFFMDGSVKHLMPALRSPLFVPHVGAYVLGYLFLVRAALGAGRRLVGLGFFLITVGLVLGAAWGKVCWGHWWQFDPKEMWSLATWLTYAVYFHLRPRLPRWADRVFLVVGAVLVVLTLTWVSLSKMFSGMHSYA